jgi:hypothetical protein
VSGRGALSDGAAADCVIVVTPEAIKAKEYYECVKESVNLARGFDRPQVLLK